MAMAKAGRECKRLVKCAAIGGVCALSIARIRRWAIGKCREFVVVWREEGAKEFIGEFEGKECGGKKNK